MKRARAGSISGRLRSASDLEEKGLIDKSQKGALKDLIISGDAELQAALDLYDKGDASQLEGEKNVFSFFGLFSLALVDVFVSGSFALRRNGNPRPLCWCCFTNHLGFRDACSSSALPPTLSICRRKLTGSAQHVGGWATLSSLQPKTTVEDHGETLVNTIFRRWSSILFTTLSPFGIPCSKKGKTSCPVRLIQRPLSRGLTPWGVS